MQYFEKLSTHTGHGTIQNAAPVAQTYDCELYLAKTVDGAKFATSGKVTASLAGGGIVTKDFTVSMATPPTNGEQYHVYLAIYETGATTPLIIFVDDEDVMVWYPEAGVTGVTWD